MTRSTTLPGAFLLLLLCSLLQQRVSATCFDPWGNENANLAPCSSGGGNTFCCNKGDSCLSNGLCKAAGSNSLMTQQGCTNKDWASCNKICPGSDSAMFSQNHCFTNSKQIALMPCVGNGDGTGSVRFCCGTSARACCRGSAWTSLGAGSVIFVAANNAPAEKSAATTSAPSRPATTSSPPAKSKTPTQATTQPAATATGPPRISSNNLTKGVPPPDKDSSSSSSSSSSGSGTSSSGTSSSTSNGGNSTSSTGGSGSSTGSGSSSTSGGSGTGSDGSGSQATKTGSGDDSNNDNNGSPPDTGTDGKPGSANGGDQGTDAQGGSGDVAAASNSLRLGLGLGLGLGLPILIALIIAAIILARRRREAAAAAARGITPHHQMGSFGSLNTTMNGGTLVNPPVLETDDDDDDDDGLGQGWDRPPPDETWQSTAGVAWPSTMVLQPEPVALVEMDGGRRLSEKVALGAVAGGVAVGETGMKDVRG